MMGPTAGGDGGTEVGSAFAGAALSVRVGSLPTPGSAPREQLFGEGGDRHVNRVFCQGKIDGGHVKRVLHHEK